MFQPSIYTEIMLKLDIAYKSIMLDNFYKRPDVNIADDRQGLNIKNSLRHIAGSAREYRHYPCLATP